MDLQLHREREDQGYEVLVATLADLPTEIAESLLRGEKDGEPGPLVPIPAGIWRQTATSDADDAGKPYRLLGTDDENEWEGAILSPHLSGYRKIQIQTRFVLNSWPEEITTIRPPTAQAVVAQAELGRLIDRILFMTPETLAPLSHREVHALVKLCMPSAPRQLVRDLARQRMPDVRRGPRGPRNPDRQRQIEELGRKVLAAQLHN